MNQDEILNLKNRAISLVTQASTLDDLEQVRQSLSGRSGEITELLKKLPKLNPEARREVGKNLNEAKGAIEEAIENKKKLLGGKDSKDKSDLSLPGTPIPVGVLHPITAVAREMNEIFHALGFSIADGPEIENDEYNYDRLNLPKDHPARDLQDTLYIQEPDILLRTHTSSVEAHILADKKPPYRYVFPGKCYRYENVSAGSHMMFFQYQGLAVGEGITMANLKATLNTFTHKFYGPNRKTRFRCKYYPEVEPGVGLDVDCPFCTQKGCAVCKGRGWIELSGAGMVHPKMLERVNLSPKKYSGFAFGMGLDRIAMTRYGINDIRAFFNGDLIYKL